MDKSRFSSNSTGFKFKPLTLIIIGVLYSSGSFIANAQEVTSNTDITGKKITDGLKIDTKGVTVNINGGTKITGDGGTGLYGGEAVNLDVPGVPDMSNITVNISGSGTSIVGVGNGVRLNNAEGATVNITDGARIQGVNNYGVYVRNDHGDSGSDLYLTIDRSTVSGGEAALRLWDNNMKVNVTDSSLSSDHDGLIWSNWGNSVLNMKGSTVSAQRYAIKVSSSVDSKMNISDSSFIAENGEGEGEGDGYGMYVRNSSNNEITFDHSKIKADNAGIYYDSSNKNNNTTISNGSTVTGAKYGILGDENSDKNTVTVLGSTIQSDGDGASLGSNYTLNVKEGTTLQGDNGIVLSGDKVGSTVDVQDSTVTGTTNLLKISGTSAVNAVSFTGSTLSGAITTSSGADQAVAIDSSDWHGNASHTGTGALALNLSNGATWTNTAESDVSSVSLSGGSTLIMDGGNINIGTLTDTAPVVSDKALLTANTPAASTIYSTWNATTGSAYTLTAGTATGTFNAGVTSNSSGAAGDMTGNTIVQVADASGATFNATQSDVGVFRYQSRAINNADGSTSVILDNLPPEPTPEPTPDPSPSPDTGGSTLSTAAQAVVGTRAAALNLWNDEQDALNSRMDNERRAGTPDGNLNAWGSYYGGYHRQQMNMASSSYDQTNNGFMVGADKRVDIAPGNLLFGFAVTRGYSDVNMHDRSSAGTDVDSYGASLYASLRMNNGLFIDANIKGTHLKNDISVTSLDGGKTSGDYSTNGFGGSLKTGYHQQINAWYVEPYAQVSYARYNGVDYTLKNGLHSEDSGYTSLALEGGANVGMTLALNNGVEVRPYVHLAVAGETESNNDMHINGVKIDDSTDGSRGIAGLGADVKFSKKLGAWAGANYAKGENNYESPWLLNAGVSYLW